MLQQSTSRRTGANHAPAAPPLVVIIDDDRSMREALVNLLRSVDIDTLAYASTSDFLGERLPDRPGCLLLDVRMPGLSGLELQRHLSNQQIGKPIIFLTAFADIPMTVQAMKAGAVDFLTKPCRDQALLDAIAQAIALDVERRERHAGMRESLVRFAQLTPREKQVFRDVAAGRLNKQIAFDLGISLITVKLHRGNMMRKLGARSVSDLIRIWETIQHHIGSRGDHVPT